MLLLIQKLLPVMLAVNIQKTFANFPKLGDCDGPTIHSADILSIIGNLPLQQQTSILIRVHTVLRKARKIG